MTDPREAVARAIYPEIVRDTHYEHVSFKQMVKRVAYLALRECVYDAADAAIAAYEAAQWRPISEAPEDEVVLLFVPPDWVDTGFYQPDGEGGGHWRWFDREMHPNHSPTHFRYLPTPPETSDG